MPIDYSQALGNFGVKYTIKWRGREYPVQFLTDPSRQAFEHRAKRAALDAARRVHEEGLSTREEYEADRERILRHVHRGFYGFWGPKCLAYLAEEPGENVVALLDILIREADPTLPEGVTEQVARDEPAQVRDVLDLIMAEVTARAKEKKALPADWEPPKHPTLPGSTPPSPSTPTTAAGASRSKPSPA
jgi:hypothetical protein